MILNQIPVDEDGVDSDTLDCISNDMYPLIIIVYSFIFII